MRNYHSILARLPQHEFNIRKHCADDKYFRLICGDYEEAANAQRFWQNAGEFGEKRSREYAKIMDELETEILGLLDLPKRVEAAN
ncbi:MAG: hypothetical protein WBS20_03200 [Lysobacterales bacterium]